MVRATEGESDGRRARDDLDELDSWMDGTGWRYDVWWIHEWLALLLEAKLITEACKAGPLGLHPYSITSHPIPNPPPTPLEPP